MGNSFVQRIIFDSALFVSVFLLPWWMTVIVALAVLFLYTAPEAIIAGLLIDVLHATPLSSFFNFEYIFTIFFILLFVLASTLKRSLLTYS